MSNKVVLSVDRFILARLMMLPEGVELKDLFYDISTDRLKVLLVGEEFPETEEGRTLPDVTAEYFSRDAMTQAAHGDRIVTFRGFRQRTSNDMWYKRKTED